MRGSDNLRQYLSEAVLPPIHSPGEKLSATRYRHPGVLIRLSVKPDHRRKLGIVHSINRKTLDRAILRFRDRIPNFPLEIEDHDPATGLSLRVAASATFDVQTTYLSFPGTFVAVEELALQTASRIVHMAFPDTSDYAFEESVDQDPDRKMLTLYRLNSFGASSSGAATPLLVFALPQHFLTSEVVSEFIAVNDIEAKRPTYDEIGFPMDLTFARSLWLKIADNCAKHRARYFVLTNYQEWCFGYFSDGWSTGSISNRKKYDSADPTILQSLVFWIASSLGVTGGLVLPNPPENVEDFHIEVPDYEEEELEPAAFDEDWSCGNSETSQPNYQNVTTHIFRTTYSAVGNPNTLTKPAKLDDKSAFLAHWFKGHPESTGVVQHHPEEQEWEESMGRDDILESYYDQVDGLWHDVPADEKFDLKYPAGPRWRVPAGFELDLPLDSPCTRDEDCKSNSSATVSSQWSTNPYPRSQPFGHYTIAIQEPNSTYYKDTLSQT